MHIDEVLTKKKRKMRNAKLADVDVSQHSLYVQRIEKLVGLVVEGIVVDIEIRPVLRAEAAPAGSTSVAGGRPLRRLGVVGRWHEIYVSPVSLSIFRYGSLAQTGEAVYVKIVDSLAQRSKLAGLFLCAAASLPEWNI